MKTLVAGFSAIFLLAFFCSNFAVAQNYKSRKLYRDAEKSFSEGNYENVILSCKDALHLSEEFEDARFLLGRCLLKTKNAHEAEQQLVALEESENLSNQVKYYLALTYKMQGRYDLVIQYFDEFLAKHPGRNLQTTKAQIEKEGAVLAQAMLTPEKDAFEFKNASERINSEKSEFAVAFGEAPNKIIISSLKSVNSDNGENLKYLYAQGWMQVSENDEFDFLNTPAYEGACAMEPTGKAFYFTQCQGKKCRIMFSEQKDGIWLKAVALGQEINHPEANTVDPALSAKGDTLFFASNRHGGIGDFDIWFSVRRENGSWSDAINLGSPVNTPFQERSPFSANDGAFYFSSDGHPGLGGLDVFYTTGLDGKREIINAGLPFNSAFDDQHLIVNDETGYLASDRAGGFGAFDIYTFVNNKIEEVQESAEEIALAEEEEAVYSSLFASGFYGIAPKFLENDHKIYDALTKAQRKKLSKSVTDKLGSLSDMEKDHVISEDKILYAALSREKKFFVDKLTAVYFENKDDLLMIEQEDLDWFMAMEVPEQRKLYRLMAASVYDIQQEFIVQNTPLIVDEDTKAPDVKELDVKDHIKPDPKKPVMSIVQDYDGETYTHPVQAVETAPKADIDVFTANASFAAANETEPGHPTEKFIGDFAMTDAEGEQFSKLMDMGSSLHFYQQLPFTERKRVDRIMAIKLVNEKYVLNPTLSLADHQYYQSLPAPEKEIVDRLQLYFRSWDPAQESSHLKEGDIRYLSSLPENRQEATKRVIVRRGIGVDDDNQIKFAGADWERYKKFSNDDIERIKDVAQLLKAHNQVFDVALAYAGDGYAFDNNLALRRSVQDNNVLLASSDPEVSIEGTGHIYESVYFDKGEFNLRKEALAAFNEIVNLYRQNPEIFISLSAYSADLDSKSENDRLARQRVSAAKEYMRKSGIPDYKIRSNSYSAAGKPQQENLIGDLEQRKMEVAILNSSNVFLSENTTYLVQPGNTLYSLSKANGVNVEELMAMNGLTDYNILAYQPLRVRKNATLDPDLMVEPSLQFVYNEEPAEGNVEISEEVAVENEANSRGEKVLVFEVKEEPVDTRVFHTVKKGEKLKSLAKLYNVSPDQLMKLNNKENKRLKTGEKLLIRK